MTPSHRPFGTEHPYRYDTDQRVPPRPIVGEPYEIRVLAEGPVTKRLDDGRVVRAVPADDVVLDFGAQPAAPAGGVGHLSVASTAREPNQRVWVATVVAGRETGYEIDGLGRFPVGPMWWEDGRIDGVATDVRWLRDAEGPRLVRFALEIEPEEHVVGFGERFHSLDQRGQIVDAVVFEQYKRQGHRTYLPTPFAIVTGGGRSWGFHVATSRRTWFDVGATDPRRIVVSAEVTPEDPILRLRRYEGDPASILRAFLVETGLPPVPPKWIFEPWMSGNQWNTQERVLREVRQSLALDIPVGAIVIEAWSDESTFVAFRDAQYEVHPDGAPHHLADFTFPPDGAWPSPQEMVEELHAAGIKVLLWQIPLVPTDRGDDGQIGADLATMRARGYAVKETDGTPYRNRGWWFPGALLPDWTNPDARRWWLDKRRYLVDELGIDGFKTDGGEHAWGHDLRYFDGTRGDAGNNLFPVHYAAAYHELTEVTFSRAGFTGSAAFPAHWAGDENSTWEGFRDSLTAGLTAAASGISYWGWDLAGFSGEPPTAELYLRSAAAACFAPIMQYHSEFGSPDRTPWHVASLTGEPEVVDIYRRFAKLRLSLVPYLHAASSSGGPLMRPLLFDFADDPEIWRWPLQWMLGDKLLVAPVTSPGATTWRVYLPAGEWADYFTGEVHIGPCVVERAVPLDEIPVFDFLPT